MHRGEKIPVYAYVCESVAQLQMAQMCPRKWGSDRLFRCLCELQKVSEDSGGCEITANFCDSDYNEGIAIDTPEFALPLG